MASTAGKKKNKKKTTLSLHEFLGEPTSAQVVVPKTNSFTSWADEMENQNTEADDLEAATRAIYINRAALPTAPRAARASDVDESKVPTEPPFTAFIGNLPFEISSDELRRFFKDSTVVNIRLQTDQAGRMKGFGYIEFETRQMLIDALALNDATLKNRQVRVDLAGQNQDKERRDGDHHRRDDDEDDKTLGDWRRKEDRSSSEKFLSSRDRRDDFDRGPDRRGPDRMDRDRMDRGPERMDRGPEKMDSRHDDRGSDRQRFGRDNDRYGHFNDRSGHHDDHDREFSRSSFGTNIQDRDRGGDRYNPPQRDRFARDDRTSFGGDRYRDDDRRNRDSEDRFRNNRFNDNRDRFRDNDRHDDDRFRSDNQFRGGNDRYRDGGRPRDDEDRGNDRYRDGGRPRDDEERPRNDDRRADSDRGPDIDNRKDCEESSEPELPRENVDETLTRGRGITKDDDIESDPDKELRDNNIKREEDRDVRDTRDRDIRDRDVRDIRDRDVRDTRDRDVRNARDKDVRDTRDRDIRDRDVRDARDRDVRDTRDRDVRDIRDRDVRDTRDRDNRDVRDTRDRDVPKERPKLNLKPRTKPLEEAGQFASAAPSIFGGAKPVDTTQREREIEEKLKHWQKGEKEKERGESRTSEDDKPSTLGRQRSESHERTAPEETGLKRQTSATDRSKPRKQTSQESTTSSEKRRDRDWQPSSSTSKASSSSRKQSYGDLDEPPAAVEQSSESSEKSAPPPVKMIPAPPPKENIWEKRKSLQPDANKVDAVKDESSTAAVVVTAAKSPEEVKSKEEVKFKEEVKSKDDTKERTTSEGADPSASSSVFSTDDESHSSGLQDQQAKERSDVTVTSTTDAPKVNIWEARKKGIDAKQRVVPSSGPGADRDGPRTDRRPPVTATASAARGNDRRPVASGGRGGAWKRPEGEREPVTAVVSIKQKKEKPLPTTIDELPKLEDKSKKDWSDSNKFSSLLLEDEDYDVVDDEVNENA